MKARTQKSRSRFRRASYLALTAMVTVMAPLVASEPAAAATPRNNVIVKMGSQPSNPTSWLVIHGQRYWIPNGGVYQCLKNSGVAGAYMATNAELNAMPDQKGQAASCGAGNNPRGNLDSGTGGTGTVRVQGWATDPNVRTRTVEIHIYIGGHAGQAGAEGHNLGRVGGYRPDVQRVYPGDGNYHGYDVTLRTSKRGPQTVCAYGINVGPGANTLLGCTTATIAHSLPSLAKGQAVFVRQAQAPSNGTIWLLVDGQRYWVPNPTVYNCLASAGVAGPYWLMNATLNGVPDQQGRHAACGAGNNPRGNLDSSAGDWNSVRVRGWATDPNVRTRSVEIHAYVGGRAGEAGAEGHNLGRADKLRADVERAYPGDGNYHGFDVKISTSKAGTLPVCVYAINIGPGINTLLGCKTTYIAPKNPYALGSPWAAGSYAYPLNAFGYCNVGPGKYWDHAGAYKSSYLKDAVINSNGTVSCQWWSYSEGEPPIPSGIYPTFTSASNSQVCAWQTGESSMTHNGIPSCLWTKGHYPSIGADGKYR